MIGTHRARRGRESRAGDGAAQVVIGITVAAGKMRTGETEDFLDLGGSPPCRSKCLATQKSTMLQSGCGKRWRIRHRCIQA